MIDGAVSPDGSQLALLHQMNGRSSVLALPMTGGEPRVLYEAENQRYLRRRCFAWTPDGGSLVFCQPTERAASYTSNRVLQLWRISAEGGAPEPLEFAAAGLLNLDIHPDGRRVAYTRMQWSHELRVTEGLLADEEEP